MKHSLLLAGLALALCSGCASIVSHSRWPVAIGSVPVGATVTITNRNGQQVYSGTTPVATELKSGAGFFQGEYYTLNFVMPGYAPQTMTLGTGINGWYFGNFLFGGLIGFLIVDPATGAMYRLNQREIHAVMAESKALVLPKANANGLQIVSIDQIPAELRNKLVPVKYAPLPHWVR